MLILMLGIIRDCRTHQHQSGHYYSREYISYGELSFHYTSSLHSLQTILTLRVNEKYHAARNTFLIYKGNTYPAKTIRGLAYKIANNETLGSDQYSGGMETVKFFERYGFPVKHAENSIAEKKKSEVKAHRKKLNVVSQKNALQKLLQQKFGIIETERKYDWLKTPDPVNSPQEYKDIIKALVEYRNQGGFLKSGLHPSCDFVFEDHKLMFEYDEYQHFSQARKIALENYPETIHMRRHIWIRYCLKPMVKNIVIKCTLQK